MSRLPRVHHVVYAVAPDRLNAAAAFFTELGFKFAVLELAELGLRVTLDWADSVELVRRSSASTGRARVSHWTNPTRRCWGCPEVPRDRLALNREGRSKM